MNENDDNKVAIAGQALKHILGKNPLVLKIKLILLGIGAGFLLLVLILLVLYSIFKPIIDVMFKDNDENVSELNKEELEFRNKINDVYNWAKEEYGVEINRPLLVSTILYSGDYSQIYTSDIDSTDLVDNSEDNSSDSDYTNEDKYKISKSELKKLAKMMISKTKPYTLDDGMKEESRENSRYYNHLKDKYVPHKYEDFINENNREGSIKSIIKDIYDLASMYEYLFKEDNETSTCNNANSCTYDINGFYISGKGDISKPMTISNLMVRLMQAGTVGTHTCGGTYGEPIEGEELVPFEKYILGVVYGEMGDSSSNLESRKAQAIAARSYALARAIDMGSSHGNKLEEENGQWILQVTNCVSDQVYCDPDKGCSKKVAANNQWGNVYSGINNPITYKDPLPQDSLLRTAVSETSGKVLVNASGNVVYAGFVQSDQNAFERLEAEGKDYTEILLEHYNSGSRPYGATAITEANCNLGSGGLSCGTNAANGDYKNWKQLKSLGAPWWDVPMGGSNINAIGCLATSTAIQIARSGINTGISDFNPGTFVKKCQESGCILSSGDMVPGNVSNAFPGFTLATRVGGLYGTSQQSKVQKAQELINQGCYLVAEVKGNHQCSGCGQHWVAVDYVSGNEIYMMDPASTESRLFSKYGNKLSEFMCYKTT